MFARAPGNPVSRQLKPSRKNSCIYECIDEERVTKAGEETIVESLRAARQETFYCGLTLPKHMKTIETQRLQSAGKNSS